MSESRIIEREANKLAEAVTTEINQVLSISTIDAINPPSTMGSLVSLSTSDVLSGKYLIQKIYTLIIL